MQNLNYSVQFIALPNGVRKDDQGRLCIMLTAYVSLGVQSSASGQPSNWPDFLKQLDKPFTVGIGGPPVSGKTPPPNLTVNAIPVFDGDRDLWSEIFGDISLQGGLSEAGFAMRSTRNRHGYPVSGIKTKLKTDYTAALLHATQSLPPPHHTWTFRTGSIDATYGLLF